MPVVIQTPDTLKPFRFFAIDLSSHREGDDQAIGACPFCRREGKLYVGVETGQWDCKVCGEAGNVYSLLRRMWEESRFDPDTGADLAGDRHLLSAESLDIWGVRWSFLSDDCLIPGYGADGKLNQVYKRVFDPVQKRWYLQGPKGVHHALHGVPLFDWKKRDVYLCEGFWDGVALWEMLQRVKTDETDTLVPTGNRTLSLAAWSNVLATPSANVFNESWCPLFAGKRVYLLYDNDHPAKATGRCGALEGMKHVASVLAASHEPPEEMHFIRWGSDGDGYDAKRKHGYDLRDLLTTGPDGEALPTMGQRVSRLDDLLAMTEPVPADWVKGGSGKKGRVVVPTLECKTWDEVVTSCHKALTFTEGLDRALSVMLAAAASVEVGADQLWVKVISPASGGKTTLCDGVVMARKCAVLKSITTGLHSGYREGGEDAGEDVSLMSTIRGKAMVIKDGDTLLQADNLPKIQSELRDAYDTKSSTHYRNGVIRDYEDHRFVVILCGTSALRKMDTSELGQRFLDCVIMEGIDEEIESTINDRSIDQFESLMASQATANGDRTEGRDTLEAKQRIGGYLEYLRRNMLGLISEVKFPPEAKELIKSYAKGIALFRARPSVAQTEEFSRELSTRLLRQLSKLAYCLAVVLNRTEIDEEVLRRVRQCALDTARGKTLKVAVQLHKAGTNGTDPTSLSQKTNTDPRELRPLLIFMRGIDIVETHTPKGKVGLGSAKMKWRLTPSVRKLYALMMK